MKTSKSTRERETVLLVGLGARRGPRGARAEPPRGPQESLDELSELARSAGAEVAGKLTQVRDKADPATLFGTGKLEEIKLDAEARGAQTIIVDASLTPGQQRNIERATGRRVIDRVQLILDIFARHARSREGQLQVELAQLNYLLPRLAGRGTEMSRLGGGIGTRGPGEQKLETDRRRIRERIARIEQALEGVRRERDLRRQNRRAVPLGIVALVGYTNAGKSTLFNALTQAGVDTSARMFATLDPTVRAIRLPSRRRVLLSDTVGFIHELPPGLIAAFRGTLEELREAALILHVIDASNPRFPEQQADVDAVLRELGVEDLPRLLVYNKIDRLPEDELERRTSNGDRLFVSALERVGLEKLIAAIDRRMAIDPIVRLRIRLPLADGQSLAAIRASGRVLDTEVRDSELWIEAELPESVARRFQPGQPAGWVRP
ncbi:MAG TPA: GTPase HflX [Candidatus Acidoferrales bacterium]|nr:GTPase HflX [Candidatus Acidoferrales bacterium]